MTDRLEQINVMFLRAANARTAESKERRNNEQFFVNDVESTLSQFTENQQDKIRSTYNIPISTKLTYPIIEQLLALVTATKPSMRLLSTDESTEDFTMAYTKQLHACMYENKFTNKLEYALRDSFVTGEGCMRVRKNDFYNETTFNTVIDHVDWRHVYVDPESRDPYMQDAEFIFLAQVLRKKKAERLYDIKISDDECVESVNSLPYMDVESDTYAGYGTRYDKDDNYVWIRTLYEKVEINLYISEDGVAAIKRPKAHSLPNPDKVRLQADYDQLTQQFQQSSELGVQATQAYGEEVNRDTNTTEEDVASNETMATSRDSMSNAGGQQYDLQQKIQQLQQQMDSMPDNVPGFMMTTESGESVPCYEYTRLKKKRIKSTLMVGDTILETEMCPGDIYPIVPFPFLATAHPRKRYGITHFIKDIVKAINKFYSMMIYDMQVNGNRKVIAFEGSVIEPSQIEEKWSQPGTWTFIRANPSLPDGGRPTILEPSPLNQSITMLIQTLMQLVEYITGMTSVMQGNPDGAPQTFGGTQSMQNFGSQRVKLYSRNIETSLEYLALTTIAHLQKYSPRDKVTKYFDENGDQQEIQIMQSNEDLQFKVRVDITNNLPTARQAAAQFLGMIAGQTKSPQVADMLTQFALQTMDLPEGKKWAEQIDVIKNLEQQLQQAQEQLQKSQGEIDSMQNNFMQKEIAHRVEASVASADQKIAVEQQKSINDQQNPEGDVGSPTVTPIAPLEEEF